MKILKKSNKRRKKRKLSERDDVTPEIDDVHEKKEKISSLVDDFWASMQEPDNTTNGNADTVELKISASKTVVVKEVHKPAVSKVETTSSLNELSLDYEFDKGKGKEEEEIVTFKFAGEILSLKKKEAISVGANVPTSKTSTKKSNNINSILNSSKGKTKMTTLQKSSLDWNNYKKEEKIEEEVAAQAKDGYLGKVQFLQRADYRQFENEKEVRNRARQIEYKKSINS